jgi:hypothetical protein
VNKNEAYDLGDQEGFLDAANGVEYDAYNDEIPEEVDAAYREGYAAGYREYRKANS